MTRQSLRIHVCMLFVVFFLAIAYFNVDIRSSSIVFNATSTTTRKDSKELIPIVSMITFNSSSTSNKTDIISSLDAMANISTNMFHPSDLNNSISIMMNTSIIGHITNHSITSTSLIEIDAPSVNETKETSSLTILKQCNHRKNKIIFSYPGAAGLGDRLAIFSQLSDLAGYYCATPVVSPPSVLLSSGHNNGQKVDIRMEWGDFQNIRWKIDKTSVLESSKSIPKLEDYINGNTTDWLALKVHRNWSNFVSVFQTVDDYILDNPDKGFIVELSGYWYDSQSSFQRWKELPVGTSTEAITTRQMKKAHHTLSTAPSLVEQIRNELPIQDYNNTVFLHIRRGDTIRTKECNNSIHEINTFLLCSLNNTASLGKLVILLASDEQDKDYREQVKSIIVDNFNHTVVMDVDNMVQTRLLQAIEQKEVPEYFNNNYYVYKIGQTLKSKCHFNLYRSRSLCPACIPLK